MLTAPIQRKAFAPVRNGIRQDVAAQAGRISATSNASGQSSHNLQDPPQEMRRLMAVDPNVLASNYWMVGVGWDIAAIRSDLAAITSGQRPLRVATDHYDNEGRVYDKDTVVINFIDVASTYGLRALKDLDDDDYRKVHWEGVRLCLRYVVGRLGLKVIGIIFQHWRAYDGPLEELELLRGVPQDIKQACEFIEETPNLDLAQHRHANDEMTIKLAYRRNCRILDNDDYAGWLGIDRGLRNEKIRKWLEQCQEVLHMNYTFVWNGDACGFEVCSFTRRNVSRSGGLGDIGLSEVNKLREGWTPLCTAAKAGDVELVRRLLKHGANPNVANCEGVYPIYFATLDCNVDMVDALIQHGADLSLIPAAKFKGLVGNVHWRLGKRKYIARKRRLLVLLGLDANSRDPMAVTSSDTVEIPGGSRSSHSNVARPRGSTTQRLGATHRRRSSEGGDATRRTHERGGVVVVHRSPPRNASRTRLAKQKHRTVGLHPTYPYRKLLRFGHKKKRRDKPASPERGTIDLEAIDLTQDVDPPRRQPRPTAQRSKENEAVYLKKMRTSGPDGRPLIAMVDPYI